MYNIQTLNKISQLGLDQLDSKEFVVSTESENPDGILVRSADMHQMELASNLRAIARAGAGTNNIPIDKCSEAGIVVFNTPGANANAVKELVICALLLASRDVIRGIKWAWNLTDADGDVEKLVEKQKSQFVGPELMGKNLGVIGLGAVGVKVANAALKLGMNVYGYDPYLSVQNAIDLNHAVQVVDLKTVYAMSDYITIHSPLLPSTKGMINEPSLDSMRQGVRIINLARGGLVDDQDMLAAIASGKVARYVTDFPNNTLVGQEGVVTIPHLGASTPESEENCAIMAAQELSDYLLTGNIRNSVNFPNVEMARGGVARLAILHRNVPNMLSNILTLLGKEGANIENMVNKSKGEYAYTLIELSQAITGETLDHVRNIDGVLRLRIIKY
ncbi:MAG: phosphoglycerate dehydrogenase [Oscillospiraceae bacterium]|nr:phosphoglycerate dehydrogenase [Oscillospiraceae bacterium]